jgi:hypothetical protein
LAAGFYAACGKGNLEIVELLFVDMRNHELDNGLVIACENNFRHLENIIKYLLEVIKSLISMS